jgi:hypothetical protein
VLFVILSKIVLLYLLYLEKLRKFLSSIYIFCILKLQVTVVKLNPEKTEVINVSKALQTPIN